MPRISGNYYLVLYESDPAEYLVKYPVVIYENAVGIQTSIHRTAPLELVKTHQEIDALADLTAFSVQNPFDDVQWSVVQNRDWNSLRSFRPRYLRNGHYDFDYNNGENAFPGNNIFRFVDSKNIPVPTLRIPRYDLQERWHAYVVTEKPRGIDPVCQPGRCARRICPTQAKRHCGYGGGLCGFWTSRWKTWKSPASG